MFRVKETSVLGRNKQDKNKNLSPCFYFSSTNDCRCAARSKNIFIGGILQVLCYAIHDFISHASTLTPWNFDWFTAIWEWQLFLYHWSMECGKCSNFSTFFIQSCADGWFDLKSEQLKWLDKYARFIKPIGLSAKVSEEKTDLSWSCVRKWQFHCVMAENSLQFFPFFAKLLLKFVPLFLQNENFFTKWKIKFK